ncbi:SocA family protein [Lactobacillus paracasei subsp. paracasei]|nr:SocA family protein [Lacticaseibacillus paracasei subsp. paracasei]
MTSFIHLIALSRTSGHAIAYHFSTRDPEQLVENKMKIIAAVNDKGAGESLSFQVVQTMQQSFESVIEYNPYFKQFKKYSELDSFTTKLIQTHELNAVDVASYIDRKKHCTSYTLQKLLYYVYADILTKYDWRPFKATFLAFKHGPVEKYVYKVRNKHHPDMPVKFGLEEKHIGADKQALLTNTIEEVVSKYSGTYKNMNNEESNLTHKKKTPWSIAYRQGQNTQITDDMIRAYHQNEVLAK